MLTHRFPAPGARDELDLRLDSHRSRRRTRLLEFVKMQRITRPQKEREMCTKSGARETISRKKKNSGRPEQNDGMTELLSLIGSHCDGIEMFASEC